MLSKNQHLLIKKLTSEYVNVKNVKSVFPCDVGNSHQWSFSFLIAMFIYPTERDKWVPPNYWRVLEFYWRSSRQRFPLFCVCAKAWSKARGTSGSLSYFVSYSPCLKRWDLFPSSLPQAFFVYNCAMFCAASTFFVVASKKFPDWLRTILLQLI